MNDTTKHTPGPWFAEHFGDGSIAIQPEQGFTVCTMATVPPERVEANAQLIAASPDMLAALEECEMVLTKNIDWQNATNPMARYANGNAGIIKVRDHARAAIAKARGTDGAP